jgi:hypothetical protein
MVLNGFALSGSVAAKTIDWPCGRIPVSPISLNNAFLKYRRFSLTQYAMHVHLASFSLSSLLKQLFEF